MPKFASNVDLQKNELQNARLHNLSGAPGSPVEGQMYFDSTGKHGYIYTGTAQAWMLIDSYQPKSTFLTLVDSISNGLMTRLGAGSVIGRTLTGSTGITITNGDGIAGPPTFALTSGIATPGTSPKVTYDTYGRVTSGNALLATDIPTLTAVKISDFDTQVRTSRLDQMAIPTSDVGMGGRKITNLGTPTTSTDAVTKAYADNLIQGINAKGSVRAASTVNVASPLTYSGAIDGITLAQGERFLLKNQTNQAENGIYATGSGANSRDTDADTWAELVSAYVWVQEGTTQKDTGWLCTSDKGGTLGTTALTWVQFSGAGQLVAGNAIIITGNSIDVATGDGINPTGYDGNISIALETNSGMSTSSGKLCIGAGTGITVGANTISVTNPKLKYSVDCATTNPWTVTHNLGTQDLVVAVYEKSTWALVLCDIVNTSANTTTITFATAPTSAQYRVVIVG